MDLIRQLVIEVKPEYEIRIENEIVEFYYENNKISDITNNIRKVIRVFKNIEFYEGFSYKITKHSTTLEKSKIFY